jgi:hypothetical protein
VWQPLNEHMRMKWMDDINILSKAIYFAHFRSLNGCHPLLLQNSHKSYNPDKKLYWFSVKRTLSSYG